MPLTRLRNGLAKPHGRHGNCPGAGYRLARWPVGQLLRHHAGSVWEVIDDDGPRTRPWSPDYRLRCVVGSPWGNSETKGKEMTTHGEYMHRHGWTPIETANETGAEAPSINQNPASPEGTQ